MTGYGCLVVYLVDFGLICFELLSFGLICVEELLDLVVGLFWGCFVCGLLVVGLDDCAACCFDVGALIV